MSTVDKLFLVLIAVMITYFQYMLYEDRQKNVPIVYKNTPPLKCTSPFDEYVTFEYDLREDGSLLTENGRVYSIHSCEIYDKEL